MRFTFPVLNLSIGGAQRMLVELVNGLVQRGHDVTVLMPREKGANIRCTPTSSKVRVSPLPPTIFRTAMSSYPIFLYDRAGSPSSQSARKRRPCAAQFVLRTDLSAPFPLVFSHLPCHTPPVGVVDLAAKTHSIASWHPGASRAGRCRPHVPKFRHPKTNDPAPHRRCFAQAGRGIFLASRLFRVC